MPHSPTKPLPVLTDADLAGQMASRLAHYPVSATRAAELAAELFQLHDAVRSASAALTLDDEPASFTALLESRSQ